MSWLSKAVKRAVGKAGHRTLFGKAMVSPLNPAGMTTNIVRMSGNLIKQQAHGDWRSWHKAVGNLNEQHIASFDYSGRKEKQYAQIRRNLKSDDPNVRAAAEEQHRIQSKKGTRRGQLGVKAAAVALTAGYASGAVGAGEAGAGVGAGEAGAGVGAGEVAAGGMEAYTGGAAAASGADIAELAAGGAGVGGDEAGALGGGAAAGTAAGAAEAGGILGTGVSAGQALEGLTAAEGIYSGVAGQQQAAAAKRAAAADDPMAAYRAQYAEQLSALAADPSSITKTPGYEEGLEYGEQALQRQLAASGQLGSGAEKIAMQGLGQAYSARVLGAEEQRLSTLAGGGTAPTAFAGQSAYMNAINQALASLGYGATNLYQGATA